MSPQTKQHTRARRRLKASAATSSTTINRIGPKDDDADGEEEGEEEVKRTHKTSIGEMFSVREDQVNKLTPFNKFFIIKKSLTEKYLHDRINITELI